MKAALMHRYRMKDLGEAEWILGMKVERQREQRTILLSQQSYIEKLLEEYGMSDCKPADTPEQVGVTLSKADGAQTQQERDEMRLKPYLALVGALLYLMCSTRPDIAHAVGMLSRFMQNPGEKHWMAAKRVLRYLKGTKHQGLTLGGTCHKSEHK